MPVKNLIHAQYVFMTAVQEEWESDSYLTYLRILAKSCEFGELEDRMILLRIVLGIKDDTFCERLLCESNLTLKKMLIS